MLFITQLPRHIQSRIIAETQKAYNDLQITDISASDIVNEKVKDVYGNGNKAIDRILRAYI